MAPQAVCAMNRHARLCAPCDLLWQKIFVAAVWPQKSAKKLGPEVLFEDAVATAARD
jgi:hypothetical protein